MEQKYDFRLINWITMAAAGVFTISLIFILDETRGTLEAPRQSCRRRHRFTRFLASPLISSIPPFAASVLLSRKAAQLRKETGDSRYQSRDDFERGSFAAMIHTSLARPIKMLYQEPVLIAFTAWISFVWVRRELSSPCDASI